MSRDLERILGALDDVDEAEPRPLFEDRLWSELQSTLSRSTPQAAPGVLGAPEPADGPTAEVYDLSSITPREESRDSRFSGRVLLLAAAAAAVILFMLIGLPSEQQPDVATDDGPSGVTTETPVSPEEACEAYRESGVSIDLLTDASLLDDETLIDARDQLETLRATLELSGELSEVEIQRLQSAWNLLGQVRLELEQGTIPQADRTLERARTEALFAFRESSLTCFGETQDG